MQRIDHKKTPSSLCVLSGELAGKNFGRELVFSADLCYNDANEKPLSEREVARVSVTEGACVTLSLE